ncbi:50S ribosomal protein L6 [Chloroflexota bacterium]
MSRIGRLPINIPEGVTVNTKPEEITVKGPKGELKYRLHTGISIDIKENIISISRTGDSKEQRALHGLTRALLSNMVRGVSNGFEKGLEIVGVGFRGEKSGDKLLLRLGFSVPVEVNPVPGTSLSLEGTNKIKVSGIDKERVGLAAANIKAIRPADHYKGKGIKYSDEIIRLKPGKAGKAVGK